MENSQVSTLEELNRFHEFAIDAIREQGESVSLIQLFRKWLALKEREEVNAAIRQGLTEIEAGQSVPLGEYLSEFKRMHKIR